MFGVWGANGDGPAKGGLGCTQALRSGKVIIGSLLYEVDQMSCIWNDFWYFICEIDNVVW